MSNNSPCKVCFSPSSDCICPECPQCGEKGKAICYQDHPLKLSQPQLVLRTEKLIARIEEELGVEKGYLIYLNEQADSYCEDWSEA